MASAIHTEGLTKRYGETLALDSLDLDVSAGEVYGYLGPNGAGKTTTIRLLLGLHRPTAGRAELFGIDAWRDPVPAHRRVAYVAGEPFLWPSLTGAETFEFLARVRGGTDVAYRDALVERFQLDTAKKVRALSKGNRRRCSCRGVRQPRRAADPRRADLRPRSADGGRLPRHVAEAKRRGQTVFLSSHILSEVEALCDRVGILSDGRLVDAGHARAAAAPLRPHGRGQPSRAPAPQLPPLAGVRVVSSGANALRCEVTGSRRGRSSPRSPGTPWSTLTSREPSLEEIFLHHYDRADGGRPCRRR